MEGNAAELISKHPVLQALIKLEVSNTLLRLQLGEDPNAKLQERLDAALAENSQLVLQMAGREPAKRRRSCQSEDLTHDSNGNAAADGRPHTKSVDVGVMDKLSNIIRRTSLSKVAGSGSATSGVRSRGNSEDFKGVASVGSSPSKDTASCAPAAAAAASSSSSSSAPASTPQPHTQTPLQQSPMPPMGMLAGSMAAATPSPLPHGGMVAVGSAMNAGARNTKKVVSAVRNAFKGVTDAAIEEEVTTLSRTNTGSFSETVAPNVSPLSSASITATATVTHSVTTSSATVTQQISGGDAASVSAAAAAASSSSSVQPQTPVPVTAVAPPVGAVNFIEVCEIGVDRNILLGTLPVKKSLQVPQLISIFPPPPAPATPTAPASAGSVVAVSDAAQQQPPLNSLIPNISEFCFPNGVPVDIWSATAADHVSGPVYDTYHVMQFADQNGAVTYGACVIYSEKVKPLNNAAVERLLDLRKRKKAARIICSNIKSYIRYKEHMRWAKPSIVLVGNYHNNGGIAHRSSAVNNSKRSQQGSDAGTDRDSNAGDKFTSPAGPSTTGPGNNSGGLSGFMSKVGWTGRNKNNANTPGLTPANLQSVNSTMKPGAANRTGTNIFTISEHDSKAVMAADSSSPSTRDVNRLTSSAAQNTPTTKEASVNNTVGAKGALASAASSGDNQRRGSTGTTVDAKATGSGAAVAGSAAAPQPTPAKKRFSWFSSGPASAAPATSAAPVKTTTTTLKTTTTTTTTTTTATVTSTTSTANAKTGGASASAATAAPPTPPRSSTTSMDESMCESEDDDKDDGFVAEGGSGTPLPNNTSVDEGHSPRISRNLTALGTMYNLSDIEKTIKRDRSKNSLATAASASASAVAVDEDDTGSDNGKGASRSSPDGKTTKDTSSDVGAKTSDAEVASGKSAEGAGAKDKAATTGSAASAVFGLVNDTPVDWAYEGKSGNDAVVGKNSKSEVTKRSDDVSKTDLKATDSAASKLGLNLSVNTARRSKSGHSALGKVIVTRKAFCVLSNTPCHAFMFSILQKIIDTESSSNASIAAVHTPKRNSGDGKGGGEMGEARPMSPYSMVVGDFLAAKEDETGRSSGTDVSGVVNGVVADIKPYDSSASFTSPSATSSMSEAITRMQINNRNAFLRIAQKIDLSSFTNVINPPMGGLPVTGAVPAAALYGSNVSQHHQMLGALLPTSNSERKSSSKTKKKRKSFTSHCDASVPAPGADGISDGASPVGNSLVQKNNSGIACGKDAAAEEEEEEEEEEHLSIDCRVYFSDTFKIYKSQSSFQEWACSILFATISHTLVIKIMNLLLLEKSILIYGTDVGLVSAIASALMEIVTPFMWEGVFVPVMPYIAKEVLQAPVPFIIGSTSLPKMEDLSPNAAIIFLDSKIGCRDIPIEECAWFMSIPEVDANMPVSDGLSKLLKRASQRFSQYLPLYKERQAHVSKTIESAMFTIEDVSRSPAPGTHPHHPIVLSELSVASPCAASSKQETDAESSAEKDDTSPDSDAKSAAPAKPKRAPIKRPAPVTIRKKSQADLCKTFMYNLIETDRVLIRKVMDALARHNMAFCGDAVQPGGWIRYCKYSKSSGFEEFYPQWFMQPRRATTEFQEALVQTQLFVSYLDRLRIVYERNTWQREFIANWLYFKYHYRKLRERRAAAEAERIAKAAADALKVKIAGEIAAAHKKAKEASDKKKKEAEEKAKVAASGGTILGNLRRNSKNLDPVDEKGSVAATAPASRSSPSTVGATPPTKPTPAGSSSAGKPPSRSGSPGSGSASGLPPHHPVSHPHSSTLPAPTPPRSTVSARTPSPPLPAHPPAAPPSAANTGGAAMTQKDSQKQAYSEVEHKHEHTVL